MSQRFDLYSARADAVCQPGVVTLDGFDAWAGGSSAEQRRLNPVATVGDRLLTADLYPVVWGICRKADAA